MRRHRLELVADGMGGHDAGDVASRIVVEAVTESIGGAKSEVDIYEVLETANAKLFEAMYSGMGRPGMGTTIVGALLAGTEAVVFNVGDSRAYLFEDRTLVRRTRDDTLDGNSNVSRLRSHALTQSLGGTVSRRPIQPHVEKLTLATDALLLLCSDGLTDMIEDEEIAAILARNKDRPAEMLLAAALDAGGADNVTAVVIGGALPSQRRA